MVSTRASRRGPLKRGLAKGASQRGGPKGSGLLKGRGASQKGVGGWAPKEEGGVGAGSQRDPLKGEGVSQRGPPKGGLPKGASNRGCLKDCACLIVAV